MKSNKISSLILFLILIGISALFGRDFFGREWQNFEQQRVLGTQDERGFEQAVIKRVVDGDTVELSDGRKLRYIGVDTPETKHPTKEVECFGREASQHNQDMVEGRVVQLEKDVSEADRYGRLLRYVWLEDKLVNKIMIEDGYGFARSYPPDVAKQEELRQAEKEARDQNRGLWSECYREERQQLNQVIDSADQQVMGAADEAEVVKEGCVIKGNISDNGRLYHLPDCFSYEDVKIDQDKGEKWFCDELEATQAGWVKAANCP